MIETLYTSRARLPRTRGALAVLVATALGLTSCSNDTAPEDTAAPTPEAGHSLTTQPPESLATTQTATTTAASPQPAPPDEDAPAPGLVAAGYEPQSHEAAEPAELFIEDVRTGSHEGFDRVVFELSGAGEPGWDADYPEAITQLASGYAVDHAGNAALNVLIHGVPVPIDRLDQAPAPGPTAQPAGVIQEVKHVGIFEADAQYVIGLDRERPFTVSTLDNPTRLVVDFTDA